MSKLGSLLKKDDDGGGDERPPLFISFSSLNECHLGFLTMAEMITLIAKPVEMSAHWRPWSLLLQCRSQESSLTAEGNLCQGEGR